MRLFKYIDRIGVELEGAWINTPENHVTDTSVVIKEKDKFSFTGEAVSPPLKYDLVASWVKRNLPDKINHTCGVHVHLSIIKNHDYVRLMSPTFNKFFLDRMKDYGDNIMKFPADHPFWSRLLDSNPYCARDHRPEEQSYRTDKRGPRYAQLNYPYGLHGTIECRVFPGLNVLEDVMKSVDCFIDCVEDYLDTVKEILPDLEFEIAEQELLNEGILI